MAHRKQFIVSHLEAPYLYKERHLLTQLDLLSYVPQPAASTTVSSTIPTNTNSSISPADNPPPPTTPLMPILTSSASTFNSPLASPLGTPQMNATQSISTFPQVLRQEDVEELSALFASELFNVHVAVSCLHRYRLCPEAIKVVCQEMARRFKDYEIEFYLPQLTHQMVWFSCPGLETLILNHCTKSMRFALQVFFLLQGMVEDDILAVVEKATKLWQQCELAAIDAQSALPSSCRAYVHSKKLMFKYRDNKPEIDFASRIGSSEDLKGKEREFENEDDSSSDGDDTRILEAGPHMPGNRFADSLRALGKAGTRYAKQQQGGSDEDEHDRKWRYEHFYSGLHLINVLSQLSSMLVSIGPEMSRLRELRTSALKLMLTQVNRQLIEGSLLELPTHPGYAIVNIVASECVCLSSRNRVPYMMHIEALAPEGSILDMPEPTLDSTQSARKSQTSSTTTSPISSSHSSSSSNNISNPPPPLTPLSPVIENRLPSSTHTRPLPSFTSKIVSTDDSLMSRSAPLPSRMRARSPSAPPLTISLDDVSQEEDEEEGEGKAALGGGMNTPPFPITPDSTPASTPPVPSPMMQAKHEAAQRASRRLSDDFSLNRVGRSTSDLSSRGHDSHGNQHQAPGIDDEWVMMDEAPKQPGLRVLAYGELQSDRERRIRATSKHAHAPNWRLVSVIVKTDDDLRQEQLAMQIITQFHLIFLKGGLPLYLRPYTVIATSSHGGFIETVPDAISIDSLKKRVPNFTTLSEYFICTYGHRRSRSFLAAQRNFVESLAAYSLVCYLLQIKDRHNGNILLSTDGHLIHIDYGFMLSASPGSINFETAPFKLTQEFVDVMGGDGSDMFRYFRTLFVLGFIEARKHYQKIVLLVEMMVTSPNRMPCFVKDRHQAVAGLRERFKLDMGEEEFIPYIDQLINEARQSWTTWSYDSYQYYTNGIL
eukprot:TRINITY_DN2484_c0_g1_i1.p1 TRINITY_DN2484_c0_g1~~TRINITY_DN2484_c0_g1_i1.p1  ORF type:complete len:938 (+),score=182.94 TRINITY_DN2484_c0_g1_i1:1739-4552(+)